MITTLKAILFAVAVIILAPFVVLGLCVVTLVFNKEI